MSHFDEEGRQRSDRHNVISTPLPSTSYQTTTPTTHTHTTQNTTVIQNKSSPTNADLSYSTTNDTITPGNHLFTHDSTANSPALETQFSTAPSTTSHITQGGTPVPNLQHFVPQPSYVPTQYSHFYPQIHPSFPPTHQHYFNSLHQPMPITQQHPIPMQSQSYPQPCPTAPSTEPFTSAQLQVLDTRMQALKY
jgi:hypothetical protein